MENQCNAWSAVSRKQKDFINAVYAEVAGRGPLSAAQLSNGGRSRGSWWGWSDGKEALELLFRMGRVAIAGRRNFQRLYDIPERVLPGELLAAPPVPAADAKKALIVRAARALGVGTAKDLAQYFHIDGWLDRLTANGRRALAKTGTLCAELVEDGRLERVTVQGWKQPAYMVPGVRIPRSVAARAIVSPFDPLLWERSWTRAVFGFDYRIEIYVPGPKRTYGYYVLPFVLGDRFAARVDLKADRRRSTLIVHAAFIEDGLEPGQVSAALAGELRSIAAWLSLDSFAVGSKGNLARPLQRALAS
jgi:uncharacterized protein YcaQ